MKKLNKKKLQHYKKELISLKQWRNSGECASCGTRKNLTFHHIIPKSKNGRLIRSNILILCRVCHNAEHSDNSKIALTEKQIERQNLINIFIGMGYKNKEINDFFESEITPLAEDVLGLK